MQRCCPARCRGAASLGSGVPPRSDQRCCPARIRGTVPSGSETVFISQISCIKGGGVQNPFKTEVEKPNVLRSKNRYTGFVKNQIDITILCKVVDNFGDIGTVYRLARALNEVCQDKKNNFPALHLRIITDNLDAFRALMPEIDTAKKMQTVKNLEIYDWNADSVCFDAFQKDVPYIILECFQCGRPDWLERLLFDVKVPEIVHIIMLDYLSAEDYAETFHRLDSLTRSVRVTKINFMPGFTDKTGGLILDNNFMQASEECKTEKKINPLFGKTCFNVLFFSYPADWRPAVKALAYFKRGKLRVLAAQGAGLESFIKSYTECGKPFDCRILDFLPQIEWDRLLCRADLLFIRGEDSLSRACLAGIPFVWNAYPQSENYHLVKVRALLEKMRPFFGAEDFSAVENCWLSYNGGGGNIEESIKVFLHKYDELQKGFFDFSESLKKNGNLAFNLMTFITEKYILLSPL